LISDFEFGSSWLLGGGSGIEFILELINRFAVFRSDSVDGVLGCPKSVAYHIGR
jgi:hypothetical protein